MATEFDKLPSRDLAEGDYVLAQAEGGPTSRVQVGAKTPGDLGLVLSTDYATSSKAGVVKVDGTTITAVDGVISANIPEGLTVAQVKTQLLADADFINQLVGKMPIVSTDGPGFAPQIPA